VVRHRVRERLNVDVELDRIFVDSMEVNIYGAAGDLCVVGEATVRLGPTLVSELLSRIEAIKRNRPDLLRRRIVKVIYADYATPEALEAAKKSQSMGAKVGRGPYAARRRRELGRSQRLARRARAATALIRLPSRTSLPSSARTGS
jgi:hypothetical protein